MSERDRERQREPDFLRRIEVPRFERFKDGVNVTPLHRLYNSCVPKVGRPYEESYKDGECKRSEKNGK